ncbi:ABC transporter permease, partial [Parabacteroides distasonis]
IKYVDEMNYEVEDDKLNAEKSTYLLRMTVSAVMLVGLVISILSFYILMLSVYLLVQKNAEKLENLLLIGYTPARVALPYQLLTIGLNLAVLVIALVLLAVARNYYIGMITMLFPEVSEGSMMPAILLGVALLAFVS